MEQYSSVFRNKNSKTRGIKEEIEQQQFLSSVSPKNMYAVREDDEAYGLAKV